MKFLVFFIGFINSGFGQDCDSLHVTGADAALGYAGGLEGYPSYDGCYYLGIVNDADDNYDIFSRFREENTPFIRGFSSTNWYLSQWEFILADPGDDYTTPYESGVLRSMWTTDVEEDIGLETTVWYEFDHNGGENNIGDADIKYRKTFIKV